MFDFFTEKGLPPGDIVAHGFGLNYPGTSKDPSLNRQVEIILDYREKIPFNMRKRDIKDSFLNYKGFFFRTARDKNVRR